MSEREQLEQAIAALEAQRTVLGDAAVGAALAGLRTRLAELEAAAPPRAMAGERRLVTVMFADISGFTALAEKMDPETVRDLINDCFEHLVPVIRKYDGTVDKFIGDEIMALFGAPVTHENDPERALRAALEMQDALATFSAAHGVDLGLHFGINTGLVIAGDIGTREQQGYSVMGDAVNVAARLEDLSDRGDVLVGPDTYRLTAPLFDFETRPAAQVKGKEEPVPVYQLLAAKTVPGPVRGIAGLSAPLVGRTDEFHALQEAVARLQDGQGGVVTLVGEAGLGKSRLVAEARGTVGAMHTPPLQWLEGRCLSYGGSLPYLLWVDVLHGVLGTTPDTPPDTVRAALATRVQELCPESFTAVYPFLSRLLALPLEAAAEENLHQLDGEQLRANTFCAVEALLASLARTTPLVLVGEDLHWADPTSLDLLEQLLPLAATVPLLLLCVLRPERSHRSWQLRERAAGLYRERHTDLWLRPLAAAESAALVEHLLRVEDLPAALRERILARAEGNPFYLEELIRALITAGDIVRDEASGRWRATRDVTEIALPDTLQGVLLARIDRLQKETRHTLQLAAIIGRIFLYRVLAAIAREERALDVHLTTLQREELIRERARLPELEYIFKHHLTQEAAYNGLLLKERRAFHREVAEALERLFADRTDEQAGLLAYHWERAAEPEKAIEYLLRAGDQSRIAYAHAEAADFYERALGFLRDQEQAEPAARALMKLGLTYHNALDFPRSRQAYEEGFALWQRMSEQQAGESLPAAPHALRIPWINVSTLDQAFARDSYSFNMIEQLFSGLVDLTPELDIVPDVAHSWEIEDGGRRYVFHLRDDVHWSDSRPVTAADFELTWKRFANPATGSPIASAVYNIRGARDYHQGRSSDPDTIGLHCPDPLTLVIELEEPVSYFFLHLAAGGLPAPQHAVQTYGSAWTDPDKIVTNGPFRLAAWERGRSLTLVRNPTYHGPFRGNLQRVEVAFPDPGNLAEMLADYEADRYDLCPLMTGPAVEWNRARERHAAEYVSVPELNTRYVGFDLGRPPFDDVRVRRALAMAIDRETLASVILGGYQFPATGGFVPPGMPGHSPGIALPYDPEQARRLLAAAGYPDGRQFPVMELLLAQGHETLGQYLQTQWRDVLGIEVAWAAIDWVSFLGRLRQDLLPLYFLGSATDQPDPASFLGESPVGEVLPDTPPAAAYARLVEQAGRLTDTAARMRLYQQADRIRVEEAWLVPLVYGRFHCLVKPWVTHYPMSASNNCFFKDVVLSPH